MARRIPGSERTREALSDLIEGRLSSGDAKSALVRLATRLIIEEGLEAEVRDALGRDDYEYGCEAGPGHRNGYRPGRLKTRRASSNIPLRRSPVRRNRSAPSCATT